MSNKNTYITQPFLPPLEEYTEMLKQIWDSHILTNNGPFHKKLEEELCVFLGVKHICLFSNGTLALMTALQALDIKGEVITTPYSFVATSHALWWNNIKPVFIDIDPLTYNLNPKNIEAVITKSTTAILPVHVYGTPCDNESIQQIASKHNLNVIYDAAHAFKVEKNGNSILNYGDLSIISFHATKVFNTFEGGAIICKDYKMKQHIDDLKNFGFRGETNVIGPGINGKMNEMQAAMGLLQIKYVEDNIKKRKEIAELYATELNNVPGIKYQSNIRNINQNYAYFPIFIDEKKYGNTRDKLYLNLKNHNIFSRRYFYPLISQFKPYDKLESANPINLPIATKASREVICLPIYPNLEKKIIINICEIIKELNENG